jgi:hypothetical protein
VAPAATGAVRPSATRRTATACQRRADVTGA